MNICTDYHSISPYSVMILLSVAAGLLVQYRLCRRQQLPRRYSGYLAILSVICCIYGGLFLTRIASRGEVTGLSGMGGVFGMFAAAAIMSLILQNKNYTNAMFCSTTTALPLMYGIGKIGCFLGGCCRGLAYAGSFHVTYTGSRFPEPISVIPVQMIEAVTFLLIFLIGLIGFRLRGRQAAYPVLLLSAAAKGGLDFLRDVHETQRFSLNQILCLAVMLLTVAAMIRQRVHKRNISCS